MTQSDNIPNRVERLENEQIDLKLAVSSLLAIVEHHQASHETTQRNFEALINELRSMKVEHQDIRSDMLVYRADMINFRAAMLEMQTEIKGLQTENRRILDILQAREGGEQS